MRDWTDGIDGIDPVPTLASDACDARCCAGAACRRCAGGMGEGRARVESLNGGRGCGGYSWGVAWAIRGEDELLFLGLTALTSLARFVGIMLTKIQIALTSHRKHFIAGVLQFDQSEINAY